MRQLVHQGMTDGVVMGQDYVLVAEGVEFPGDPGPRLVLHEGLVEKLHEDEGKHDEKVKYARKHNSHGKQAAGISPKRNVPVAKGGHGGENPIEGLDPGDLFASFRTHQGTIYVHVDENE